MCAACCMHYGALIDANASMVKVDYYKLDPHESVYHVSITSELMKLALRVPPVCLCHSISSPIRCKLTQR
jgi:hypothetical protein